jgi:hypothetical protein
MSMTKHYLDEMSQEEQDAILGASDPEEAAWNAAFDAYDAEHGWDDSAENEPENDDFIYHDLEHDRGR